jgi:hypothetical protein
MFEALRSTASRNSRTEDSAGLPLRHFTLSDFLTRPPQMRRTVEKGHVPFSRGSDKPRPPLQA